MFNMFEHVFLVRVNVSKRASVALVIRTVSCLIDTKNAHLSQDICVDNQNQIGAHFTVLRGDICWEAEMI